MKYNMKNVLKIFFIALLCLCFTACQNTANSTEAKEEKVPEEYGDTIIVARDEFLNIFKDFEDLKITETKTMGRTDIEKTLLIEFSYTSKNGDGVYGFIMDEDEYGNAVIVEQGTDITVDKLLSSDK